MPGGSVTSLVLGRMPLDGVVASRFNISSAMIAEVVQQGIRSDDARSAAESETPPPPPLLCWHLMDASNALYLYAFPLLLMLGILFNGVNFVLFRSSIGLRLYSFTVFICAASVVDSLALVAQAPRRWFSLVYRALHWHSLLLQPTTVYDTDNAACKALSYAAELTQFVSVWTVVLLAWERSIVAQNPYRQSRFRQTRTACHAVAFVVISGLVLKSHVIVSWQTTTQPLVSMATTSANATTSLLTVVVTSTQNAKRATTKRPTMNPTKKRCTPHKQESWKEKLGCGKENGRKISNTQHGSRQDERESEYRKVQTDSISATRIDDLRPPINFVVNNLLDTTIAVNTKILSSADDHRRDLAVDASNVSKATALARSHPNGGTLPNAYMEQHILSNEDRDPNEVIAVQRTVGIKTLTSSGAANDALNKTNTRRRLIIISKVASAETDMTHNQSMTGQNEADIADVGTDVASYWNRSQQIDANRSFIGPGNTAQGFRDSPVPTEQANHADDFGNVSKPDMETSMHLHRPEAVENGSSLLQNLSASSDARPLNTGTNESTFRQTLTPNWTTQPSKSRLQKRDIVRESETQPRATPCSRLVSGHCQSIQLDNATQTTTAAVWMASLIFEALTTMVVPTVVLSGLLVSSLSGLRRWNIDQTRLSTDLTCRLLMERHVTNMAVCIMTSQVVLCLPTSVVWLFDLYFRFVNGLSPCQEAQMMAASVLTELVFMVNFTVKFLLCFTSGRQILTI